MATLDFALKNETGSDTVYAYITGYAIDRNNALVLIQADGKTPYYPASPSSTLTALDQDCAIPLGPAGSTKTVSIPHIAGGRLWFVRDGKLTFYVNPGPALVEPSSSNPSDPNYNLYWDFCEFTWNSFQLYANITLVDFVSLPIALTLTTTSGASHSVLGLPSDGLGRICSALQQQNAQDQAGWDRLIVSNNGRQLRAVSPNTGIVLDNSLFKNYYDSYVNQVWDKYSNKDLTVNTQGGAGNLEANVAQGKLDFTSQNFSYDKPSTADIFSNSSGAFAVSGNGIKDAVTARLAAAFNRSTLLSNSQQPNGATVADYYQNPVTNHYSRICHEISLDHRGYAFPYDDVAPSNGEDQSGSVFDSNPKLLTVTVGGGGGTSSVQALANNPVRQENANTSHEVSSNPAPEGKKKKVFSGLKQAMRRLSHK
ncbi:Glucan endo-1,3-beta-D-glucosidase [Penicillium ucsense]|uniref:Glucan endo-1,3-beta-D-glucosidase n=1 Tax=Penicillium ucsense TaxID=2839758 RepID=A0A8J8VYZ8_9EURO|nr:Glucan endo-1,3-beta-D-glucosidase [Penicillium ucsense]KAF7732938.1 Glucan endo-1,3-beta-D-glucosidase [Penicillium ucsense]